jgi:hypothetical protein
MPILPRRSSHPNMRSSRPDNLFPITTLFPLHYSSPQEPPLPQDKTYLRIMPISVEVPLRNLLPMIIRLLIHPRLNALLKRLVSTP